MDERNRVSTSTPKGGSSPSSADKATSFIGATRQQTDYPRWIDLVMAARWVVVAIAGLLVIVGFWPDSGLGDALWWIMFAAVVATPYVARAVFRQKDPVRAEIVFDNEVDGFCTSDGDGDGGDNA